MECCRLRGTPHPNYGLQLFVNVELLATETQFQVLRKVRTVWKLLTYNIMDIRSPLIGQFHLVARLALKYRGCHVSHCQRPDYWPNFTVAGSIDLNMLIVQSETVHWHNRLKICICCSARHIGSVRICALLQAREI